MGKILTFDHRLSSEGEPTDLQLTGAINRALKSIDLQNEGTNDAFVRALLMKLPNLRTLGLESLVYIDDDHVEVSKVVPELVVATRGRTVFLLDRGCSMEEAISAIRAVQPTLALVDGMLVRKDGEAIVASLEGEISCVGFSSTFEGNQAMVDAGAIDGIEKWDGENLVRRLEEILTQLRSSK